MQEKVRQKCCAKQENRLRRCTYDIHSLKQNNIFRIEPNDLSFFLEVRRIYLLGDVKKFLKDFLQLFYMAL